MKILCVIDSLGSGGAQRQLVELAKGFKEKGHKVSFLIYFDITFFKPLLDEVNIPVKIIQEDSFLKRIFKIRKFIREQKCDVVVSFLETPNFICEISGFPWRNWKLIVGERSADPKILKSIKRRFFRLMHVFSDEVVANSKENIYIVKKINPFLSKKRCHVIYNIIDSKKWTPSDSYLPLNEDKFRLIIAASHLDYKNARGLIEAINCLTIEEKKKLNVSWYGKKGEDNSFNEAKELIAKYRLEDIIKFYEPTQDIYKVYAKCDAVGLFSFLEGLPNTVCEGMSMGRLILASKISEIPFLLNNDNNCMFDPKSIEQIRNTISWAISLKVENLLNYGRINRENAIEYFDKNKIVESYLKILKK